MLKNLKAFAMPPDPEKQKRISVEPKRGGVVHLQFVVSLSFPRCSETSCEKRIRKGTNGVSTNGVTAKENHIFWQSDLLGAPVNIIWSSQKCQGVPFFQTIHYFCVGPISVDPICPQLRLMIIKYQCSIHTNNTNNTTTNDTNYY